MSVVTLPYRIGSGFDVHRLVPNRKLILGGIEIPFDRGLDGHSDADVLLHALCDAILGALALGDIGQHFPNTDEKWRNRDSAHFVRSTLALAHQQGYQVGNADLTIHAERPKLLPHADAIRQNVAQLLQVDPTQVGLKAGTMEKLGFIGREEGIAASVTILMARIV